MNNKYLEAITGGQLAIQVIQFDPTATDVDFIMQNDETEAVVIVNAEYEDVDGVMIAFIELTGLDTAIAGVYSYQINENTPTGINKTGTDNCTGDDCEFYKVIICESLGGMVS